MISHQRKLEHLWDALKMDYKQMLLVDYFMLFIRLLSSFQC